MTPCANRDRTSIPSYARKGSPFAFPPDLSDRAVYQDEWVSYLVNRFGQAQNGGVRLYAMDNEMDLWADNTHVDVHPVRVGYDEALNRYLEYSEAIKAVDPTAETTGPAGWGWTSLWYSASDRGDDSFAAAPDRSAHGGLPFVQWFLQQVGLHDGQVGHRTLDVLDVHIGPDDNPSEAKRLRMVRSLWDPNYADETWLARTQGGPFIRFVPRLKEWIASYYPGTKLGISEWYYANGVEDQPIGALTVAEVLGVFGREDLYFATYWGAPAEGSPAYWAWRMYRNYDGAYSGFGDLSVAVQASDDYKVSAYASRDSRTGQLKVMLINKMPATEAKVALALNADESASRAQVYQYSKQNLQGITRLPDLSVALNQAILTLPSYSITLVVVE